jgi:hypothetical protein
MRVVLLLAFSVVTACILRGYLQNVYYKCRTYV